MYAENENLVLCPITADESTSIRDKTSLFSKMSVGILEQYDAIFEESSQLRSLYDSYRDEICNKPLVKMDQDLQIFEDKNSQIN